MGSWRVTLRSTAFPVDTLRVLSFRGREALNEPWTFDLRVESRDPDLDPATLLLAPCALEATGPSGEGWRREGILAGIEEEAGDTGASLWRLHLASSLGRLGRGPRFRAFRDRVLPEVLEELLGGWGIPCQLQEELRTRHRPLPLACQYGEPALAFLDRWCERLGLLYAHQEGTGPAGVEPVVLVEDITRLPMVEAPLLFGGGADAAGTLASFTCHLLPPSSGVILKGVNLRRPSLDPMGRVGEGGLSHFGAPCATDREAEHLARIRHEGMEGDGERFTGQGVAPSLRAGSPFTLAGHPRAARNGAFRVLSLEHEGGEGIFRQSITAIRRDRPWRPPARTPWPRVEGTLLARVGEASEGAGLRDDLGRFPVLLPFDDGDRDRGPVQVWAPLLQPYGGGEAGFGANLEPGTDVLLAFVLGDPDRPVIAGALPTADHPSLTRSLAALAMRSPAGDEVTLGSEDGADLCLHTPGLLLTRSHYTQNVTQSHRMGITLGSESNLLVGSGASTRAGDYRETVLGLRQETNFGSRSILDVGRHTVYGRGDHLAFCNRTWNLGYTWYFGSIPKHSEAARLSRRLAIAAGGIAVLQGGTLAMAAAQSLSGLAMDAKGVSARDLPLFTTLRLLSFGLSRALQHALNRFREVPKASFIQATTTVLDEGLVQLGVDEIDWGKTVPPPKYHEGRFRYAVELRSDRGIEMTSRNAKGGNDSEAELEVKSGRGPRIDHIYRLDGAGHFLGSAPGLPDAEAPGTSHSLRVGEPDGIRLQGFDPNPGANGLRGATLMVLKGNSISLEREDSLMGTAVQRSGLSLGEDGTVQLSILPVKGQEGQVASPPALAVLNREGTLSLGGRKLNLVSEDWTVVVGKSMRFHFPSSTFTDRGTGLLKIDGRDLLCMG